MVRSFVNDCRANVFYMVKRVHRFLAILFMVGVVKLVMLTGIDVLPPSFICLVATFLIMLFLQCAAPTLADKVFKLLEPGYRFMVKWSALFLLPALIKLPLLLGYSASVLVQILLFILVGFLLQLMTMMLVSSLLVFAFKDRTPAPAQALLEPQIALSFRPEEGEQNDSQSPQNPSAQEGAQVVQPQTQTKSLDSAASAGRKATVSFQAGTCNVSETFSTGGETMQTRSLMTDTTFRTRNFGSSWRQAWGAMVYPRPERPFERRWLASFFAMMVVAFIVGAFVHNPMVCDWAQKAFMLSVTCTSLILGNQPPPTFRKVVHPIITALVGSWLGALVWSLKAGCTKQSWLKVLDDFGSGNGTGVYQIWLLNPLTMALGLLLYEKRQDVWKSKGPILFTSLSATFSGLFISLPLSQIFGLPHKLSLSAASRFVTAPITYNIAPKLGADPNIALMYVVSTGLLGATLGRLIVSRIKNAGVRGLSIGGSSHVLGAMSLAADDKEAFPFGTCCFVLNGIFSLLLISLPPIKRIVLQMATPE